MGSRNPVDSQNHRKEEKTFLQENGVDLMIRVHDTMMFPIGYSPLKVWTS